MNHEDRLAELLRADAEGFQPGDGRDAIRRRVRARRRTRTVRRAAIPLIAAAVAIAVAIPALSAGSSHRITTVNMPRPAAGVVTTTVPSNPTTTLPLNPTTTLARPLATVATARKALSDYLAAHPEAISHSDVVPEGGTFIAVVGLEPNRQQRSIVVLDLGSGAAATLADLPLPYPYFDFTAGTTVAIGDVTGDGRPEFLVLLDAADAVPGVIVSNDGGNWRLLSAAPASGAVPASDSVYFGRAPRFSSSRLQTTVNDCKPYCAAGHTTTVTWLYDRSSGYLRPGPWSVPLQGGYYTDGAAGTPHYDLTVNPVTGGFTGWLFFVYQDSRVSVLFHYTAAAKSDGTFTLTTDTTSRPFPFTYQSPPFPQVGSAAIGVGRHFTGAYAASIMSLDGCQSYLYWANPANLSSDACTFTFNGAKI
jgi:hypothetical protein